MSPAPAADAPSEPVRIQLRGLSVGYRRDKPVLRDLDLDVEPASVLAVVGPNGAGKTTLFRTLLGTLDPIGGTASIAGLSPGAYRRTHGLGYLAEDTAMPSRWTCAAVLKLASSAAGPDADIENARWLAGVDYDTSVLAEGLSKGMRRRLALAVALMRPTRLLVLDEPESGLDPGQRIRLRRRVEVIRDSMTVLVASHDLGELAMMSDQVLFIDQGRGRIVDKPEGGFTRDYLEEVFMALEGAVS